MKAKGSTSGSTSGVEVEPLLNLELGKRIALIRGSLSQKEFATQLDIHLNSVGLYERGIRVPGMDLACRMCEQFQVSPDWLLTGRGPMRRDELAPIAVNGTSPSHASLPAVAQIHPIMEYSDLPPPAPGFCYLRILDLNAAAGHGTFISIESVTDVLAIPEKWIRQELQCNPADLAVIKVRGDSMRPTIEPGQIIVLDHTDKEIPPDGVFVLRFRGGLMVKRLQMLDDGALEVTSDNHFYKPIIFKTSDVPDDFAIIGRVVLAVNWNRP